MTTTQTTTRLAYFKCDLCLTPMAAHIEVRLPSTSNSYGVVRGSRYEELAQADAIQYASAARCTCGGTVSLMGLVGKFKGSRLVATTLECPCSEKCASAVGPSCNCACGGEFHGTNAVVVVTVDAGGVPTLHAPKAAAAIAAEFLAVEAAARARLAARHAKAIELRRAGTFLPEDMYFGWEADRAALARARGLRTHRGRTKALAEVCA